MDKELEMRREIVEISNGRKLYNYTFMIDGEVLPPMRPEDVVAPVEKQEEKA